jgi:outer membrane protein assembly factor BamB
LLPLRKIAEIQPADFPETEALFQGGVLVVPSRGGVVEGFSVETGERLWKLGFPENEFLQPRAAPGGTLLSLRDGTLLEVETSTGEIRAQTSSPIPLAVAPLVGDTLNVLASPAGDIVAVDPESAQTIWTAETGETPSALSMGNNLVVVSGAAATLTAIDAQTGRLKWTMRGRGPFRAPAVFDAEGERLYIGDEAGTFYSLSSKDGKKHYRWEHGVAIVHPPLLEDDHLYVVSYGNTLTAYHAGNGHELWRFNLPGRPASKPVRVRDRLVVATMDGYVVEVNPVRGRRGTTPYRAPTGLRAKASFRPPYAALTLLSGKILLLETAPPEPERTTPTDEESQPGKKRPPKKGKKK